MNPSTTILQGTRTITFGGQEANRCPTDLYDRYEQLLEGQHLGWTEHLRFRRLLGTGGQGVVYLSDRRGCDGFTLPVALKVFSPERFTSQQSYDNAMNRMAQVACAVAQIQRRFMGRLIRSDTTISRDRAVHVPITRLGASSFRSSQGYRKERSNPGHRPGHPALCPRHAPNCP